MVDAIGEDEYENLYQVVSINGKAQLTRFKIFPIDSTSAAGSKKVSSTRSKLENKEVDDK